MSSPAPPDEPGHAWGSITKVRFFWLLASLIGFILVAPSIPPSDSGQWETMVLSLVIFFSATYVSQGLTRIWAMLIMAIILVALTGLYLYLDDPTPLRLVLLYAMLLTLIYTAVSVLSFVLEGGGAVGIEHIYGAICAYVLIAMAFATLYFILESHLPGSFTGVTTARATDRAWWQFFYFSCSTLSTVGYGDIVPTTMRARSFVVIEQLVAVFYVAILISRLTGMYTPKGKPR
jgi:hypothetical protein